MTIKYITSWVFSIAFMSLRILDFKKRESVGDTTNYLRPILCNVFIISFAFVIYSSIRYGFWRYDDGDHLYAAITKGSQLLYKPDAWQTVQRANFAPLNTLVYLLFQSSYTLNPQHLYELELLLVVVFGVVMNNVFIRFGLHWMPSLMAVSACLISEPTYDVFSSLWTLHYAFGSIFSLVSAAFFLRSDVKGLITGSIFCFLAFLFKDVFGLVLLVPYFRHVVNAEIGSYFKRWPSLLIPLCPAVIFILWRRYMLNSTVGGYNGGHTNFLDALFHIQMQFNKIFGNNILSLFILLLCVFLLIKRYSPKTSLLIVVFFLILLTPFLFLKSSISPPRYIFHVTIVLMFVLAYLVQINVRHFWHRILLLSIVFSPIYAHGYEAYVKTKISLIEQDIKNKKSFIFATSQKGLEFDILSIGFDLNLINNLCAVYELSNNNTCNIKGYIYGYDILSYITDYDHPLCEHLTNNTFLSCTATERYDIKFNYQDTFLSWGLNPCPTGHMMVIYKGGLSISRFIYIRTIQCKDGITTSSFINRSLFFMTEEKTDKWLVTSPLFIHSNHINILSTNGTIINDRLRNTGLSN